jgi:hypothetical protein
VTTIRIKQAWRSCIGLLHNFSNSIGELRYRDLRLTHHVSTHIPVFYFPLRPHTLRFVNSRPTGPKIHMALKLSAYTSIPDSNSIRMVSRVCLLSDTALISDPWSRLGSNLYSEQFSGTSVKTCSQKCGIVLAGFDKISARVRIGSVKG